MAATANAPFGPPQTPSYQEPSPWLSDGLIKQETDHNPLISSPTHVSNTLFPDFAPLDDHNPAGSVPPLGSDINADLAPLRDSSMTLIDPNHMAAMSDFPDDISAQIAESVQADLDSYAAEEPAAIPNVEPMQAYAKLQFSDGDFYVSTQAVELGRDMSASKHERRFKKQERRRKELEAASAAGDDNPISNPSHALAKRNLIISGSNASESGGIIGNLVYSGSEDENKLARRRRKKLLAPSNDSSQSQSHSVAPASLHTNPVDLSLTSTLFDGTFDPETSSRHVDIPFVPIHPAADRSITGISRKHIRIEYNGEKAYWELHVLGRNGAFIDEKTFVEAGAVARLRHNSNIQVQGIDIVFKLPDNARDEETTAPENNASDSELSDVDSDAEAEAGLEDDDSNASGSDQATPKERLKLKLSLSKRGLALDAKTQKSAKLSLKAARDKTKGGKTIPGQPSTDDVRPSIEDLSTEAGPKPEPAGIPATPAADLPPGSILAGLAPEEIPQKRKGPGRPPKNGVMSKRDEAIIKRKKKELQKAGREIPPLTELLAMARAEAGTTKKGEDGFDIDGGPGTGASATPGGTAADAAQATGDSASKPQTAAEIEAAKARKQAKSPSPQKPESEYTEEELKKPQKTYVVLIHDALSASTTGIMDLQQIYDAIQKMYPYYKYRSQTQGWQSSIRHNLIGSEAFEEAGKIGKGRLWKINPNYPIDKEKKRRAPTPPTDKPAYPYYQNGQYNNNGYPPYRPSPYGTPYGPPTTAVPSGARPPPPPPAYGQQRNGTYYSPYAANPAGQNQHASPYGAQSRPPYPPAHAPNQPGNPNPPNGGIPNPPQTAPGAKPVGPPPVQPPGQAPPPPVGRGQPPRPAAALGPPGQTPPQGSIGSDDTIEEIMSYHKRYLGGFKAGAEQDAARDLFRKAVSRHIDHNKKHGEYSSEEERKVADAIGEIIQRNKGKQKAPASQPRPLGAAPGASQLQGPPSVQHPLSSGPGPARPLQQAPMQPNLAPGTTVPPIAQHPHAAGATQARPVNSASPASLNGPSPTSLLPRGPVQQPPQPTKPGPQGSAATIDLTGPVPAAAQIPPPSNGPVQAGPSQVAVADPPIASPATAQVSATAHTAPVSTVSATAVAAQGIKRAAEDGGEDPDPKKAKA